MHVGSLQPHSQVVTNGQKKCESLKVASLKGYKPVRLNQGLFKCPLCEYRSVFRSAVTGHLPTHCDDRPFRCNQCNYDTKRSGDLRKHKLMKHGKPQKDKEFSMKGEGGTTYNATPAMCYDAGICRPSCSLVVKENSELNNDKNDNGLQVSGGHSLLSFGFREIMDNVTQSSSSLDNQNNALNYYHDIQGVTLQDLSSTCHDRAKNIATNARRSWSCQFCRILFFDSALYFMHMGLHGTSNPWKCNLCQGVYNDVYGFTSHVINGHAAVAESND